MSMAEARKNGELSRNQRFEISEEISEVDLEIYRDITTTALTDAQLTRLTTPPTVQFAQDSILAVHWHPEFVPIDVIKRRIAAEFPNSDLQLIIPTQHNVLETYDGFTGVEIDCFSSEFNRKVQLLAHFENSRLEHADIFRKMLAHTFEYRTSQLYEFFDTILEPNLENRLYQAAASTGADKAMIVFVRTATRKLKVMLERQYASTPREMIRNKLLKNFFDKLRDHYDDQFIDRVQVFVQAVKRLVKIHFSFTHFYETQEIIEEIRSLGGGIVIPHPEQFWPILLADYDVDGYEVWNPQSQEYTNFLINVVIRKNQRRAQSERPLLIFMGDDCHMGEKVKDPKYQDVAKAAREIGVQPAWDDLSIRKGLILAGIDRRTTIAQYRERLEG